MTDFAHYLQNLPLLHTWDGGKEWNTGGFYDQQLRSFYLLAGGPTGGHSIIETGAGNSTLTFLFARPKRLITIAPAPDLFGRIEAYCTEHGLDSSPLQKKVERSEIVLPGIAQAEHAAGTHFDLGLLDGGHGWPTVFVDFCYVNAMLKKGGILLVDDVQLHSVKELARMLAKQPEYRLVEDLGKVLAFEKLTDAPLLMDFGSQPYIMERTEEYKRSKNMFAL